RIVVAAALAILDGEHGGEVVHAARLLRQLDAVAAGGLADLKAADGVEGERLAAFAALVPALRAFDRADEDRVPAEPDLGAIIDPEADVAPSLASAGIPSRLPAHTHLHVELSERGGRDA